MKWFKPPIRDYPPTFTGTSAIVLHLFIQVMNEQQRSELLELFSVPTDKSASLVQLSQTGPGGSTAALAVRPS